MNSITSEEYLKELLERPLPRIENATVMIFRLPLKSAFETSFGSIDYREIVLCRLDAEGLTGYGESAADEDPLYSYETTFTTRYALEKYLLPQLRARKTIGGFLSAVSPIRGYPMAKATVEGALWDLLAKKEAQPLHKLWDSSSKDRIPCGVSIGLQKDNETLLRTLRDYLSHGYRRIKIKIKPGRDVSLIEDIRNEFPELPLMADANAAYRLSDVPLLKSLDRFYLMMIEQPLHYEDIYEHSLLQREIQTPICLDESIVSERVAKAAIALESCRIINIKTGRVGGHAESIRIHNQAMQEEIPVWFGGMLESGIGRAHNLALASLPNFTLPGDTSASNRYWHRDVIDPPVIMDSDGFVTLPQLSGIGYTVDEDYLQSLVFDRFAISL